jgi:predicted GNAT family N-acyltransferase
MADAFTVNPVTWDDTRDTLLGIRFKVFVEEQGVPPELEADTLDAHARHLLVRNPQGQAVATARLLDDGHIGRMAVLAGYRGKGIGTRMLRQLLWMAEEAGLPRVHLNAQCNAERFYQRLGFVAEGEVFEDAGIPHRRMYRLLGADDPRDHA